MIDDPRAKRLRSSRRFRQGRDALLASARSAGGADCALCGQGIDVNLSGRAAWGPSVDHWPVTLQLALRDDLDDSIVNDPSNLRLAHTQCQRSQGGRAGNAAQQAAKRRRADKGGALSGWARQRQLAAGDDPARRRRSPKAPPVLPAVAHAAPDFGHLQQHGLDDFDAGDGALPRLLSPRPTTAVDTVGPVLAGWIEDRAGVRLLPWQRSVLDHALVVDSEGRWCWDTIVVSTPRQSGKTFMQRWLLLALMANPDVLPDAPARVLLAASQLQQSTLLIEPALAWAEDNLDVTKAGRRMGQERLELTNGASWRNVAQKSGLGHSANCLVLDEAHSVGERAFADVLQPTLAAAADGLTIVTSTATAEPTAVVPRLRRQAAQPGGSVFLAEWSVAADANLASLDTFMDASPTWNRTRSKLIGAAIGSPAAATEWGNIWPDDAGSRPTQWPPGWSQLPKVPEDQPPASTTAVIESSDRENWGVATAVRQDDGQVDLWVTTADSVEAAAAVALAWNPYKVLVGASVVAAIQNAGIAHAEPFISSQVRSATPALLQAAKLGLLRHNHDPDVARQAFHVRLAMTDGGETISGRRSTGPVPAIKAAAMATMCATDKPTVGNDWLIY